tara:strand:- start:1754 stop:2035 length:282 start_codon:yes stop_codon:yes gene_type:complete
MKTKGYSKGGMKTKGYAKGGKADKDMSERTYKARVPGMMKKEARSKSSIPMIKKESGRKSPIPMIKKESGSKGAVGSAEMKEFRKMGTMKNNW